MSISNFGFTKGWSFPTAYGGDLTFPAPITGNGAVSIDAPFTRFITSGTNALTLENGKYVGQEVCVYVAIPTAAHSAVLTPTTPFGYATITFGAGPADNSGASVNLVWTGTTGWGIVGMSGRVSTA